MADHTMPEKLNLEEVGRHFESLGYRVVKLEQPWRHVTGQVKFENEKLFLKLAGTKEIGERTRNEKAFNEKANSVWKKYIKTFRSPKIFDEGYFQDKYWFVGEFVFGKPPAGVGVKRSDIEEKDLLRAAEIAKNILELTNITVLPKDRDHLKEYWAERIVRISGEWNKNNRDKHDKIIQFIEERKNKIEIGACHGDFTPWAIMKTKKDEYFLIDSEAAQMGGLKYYDVAYFYHRVYTKLKRPDLAEIFLEKFKKINQWMDKDNEAFKPVLAGRIMGGYFDAERDGVTSVELNREMEEKLY